MRLMNIIKSGMMMIFSLPLLLSGQEPQASKIIQNMEKVVQDMKTLHVVFEETYEWKLTGETSSIKGELFMQGQNRFKVTTDDQVIVSDGDTLWTYSIPSNRVLVDLVTHSKDALLPNQLLTQYTKDATARLLGEEEISGTLCHKLLFTANQEYAPFPETMVWIEKQRSLPRRIEQKDLHENRTIYSILQVDRDAPVSVGLFKFKIPENAEVIRMQ